VSPPREDLPERQGEPLASVDLPPRPERQADPERRPGEARQEPQEASGRLQHGLRYDLVLARALPRRRRRPERRPVVRDERREWARRAVLEERGEDRKGTVRRPGRDPFPGDAFEPDDEQVPSRRLRDGRRRRERRRGRAPVRDDGDGAEEDAEDEQGAEADAVGPRRPPRERRRDERSEGADEGRRDEDPPPARRDEVVREPRW